MTTVKMPTDATEAAELLWFDILNFGNDRMGAVPEVSKFLTQYAAHVSVANSLPEDLPPPPPVPDRPLPIERGTPPRSTRPNPGTRGSAWPLGWLRDWMDRNGW